MTTTAPEAPPAEACPHGHTCRCWECTRIYGTRRPR